MKKNKDPAVDMIEGARRRAGYRTAEEFCEAACITLPTYNRRKKDITGMTIGELRRIARTAALSREDIIAVIRGETHGRREDYGA